MMSSALEDTKAEARLQQNQIYSCLQGDGDSATQRSAMDRRGLLCKHLSSPYWRPLRILGENNQVLLNRILQSTSPWSNSNWSFFPARAAEEAQNVNHFNRQLTLMILYLFSLMHSSSDNERTADQTTSERRKTSRQWWKQTQTQIDGRGVTPRNGWRKVNEWVNEFQIWFLWATTPTSCIIRLW